MKKKDRYFYPAVFTFEEGRDIAVVFPDLKAATSGADEDEAFLSARELLGLVLFAWRRTAKRFLLLLPLPM